MSNEPWTTTALFCLFLCSIFIFSLFFLFFPPSSFFCSRNSFCCAALWFHWCNLCWCLNSFDISSSSKFVFISFKKVDSYLELQTVIWWEKLRTQFHFRSMKIDFRCTRNFSRQIANYTSRFSHLTIFLSSFFFFSFSFLLRCFLISLIQWHWLETADVSILFILFDISS